MIEAIAFGAAVLALVIACHAWRRASSCPVLLVHESCHRADCQVCEGWRREFRGGS